LDQRALTSEMKFFGRLFSASEQELIREIATDFQSLSLDEISRTICELLEWKRPSGGLKSHECRRMLVELNNQGLLAVPELRKRGPNGPRVVELTPQSETKPTISGEAGSLEPLTLKVVKAGRSGEGRLWRELVARHHPLGYRVPVGANLRYLVFSEQYPDTPLACLMWTSPAWKIEARDRWIGWSEQARSRNLQLIVNNSRFLLLPWVQVCHLASKILARCARQLPGDWERMYGYKPLLLETFVDSSLFRGTCYRAANWVFLGQTKGRGRMDRYHTDRGAPKLVYVYPLRGDARTRLRTGAGPSWEPSTDEELRELTSEEENGE